MERARYLLLNIAVLGVIVVAAVMIYVGVGAVSSTKALAMAIALAAVALIIFGTLADAITPPKGWTQCNRAWVRKHGKAACATSPKLPNKNIVGRHYHRAA